MITSLNYFGSSPNRAFKLFCSAYKKFGDDFYGTFSDGSLTISFHFIDINYYNKSIIFFNGLKHVLCFYKFNRRRLFDLRIYEGLPF